MKLKNLLTEAQFGHNGIDNDTDEMGPMHTDSVLNKSFDKLKEIVEEFVDDTYELIGEFDMDANETLAEYQDWMKELNEIVFTKVDDLNRQNFNN